MSPARKKALPNTDKAVLMLVGNATLVAVVGGTFGFQKGVRWGVFWLFSATALGPAIWYLLRAYSGKIRIAALRMANGMLSVVRSEDDDESETTEPRAEAGALDDPEVRIPSLWLWVALDFAGLAYLVNRTGGIIESPYASIPPTMVFLGQLLTDMPARHRSASDLARFTDLFVLLWRSVWAFKGAAFSAIGFYIAVALAGKWFAADGVGSAPAQTVGVVIAVNLLVAGVFNFVARQRRAVHRREPQPAGESAPTQV